MKNTFKVVSIALAAVLALSTSACSGSGGKNINSAEALKVYLDGRPVNGPDKPIKVTMNANDPMFENIAAAIKSAGKYVSLNLSGNNLTTIPENAFFDKITEKGCTTLVGITIPNSVTSIGNLAFGGSTNLANVVIPNSVTTIGNLAFIDCTSLKDVTIGNSVTSIGDAAFAGCTSLTNVVIPNSVTKIGKQAFLGNTSLTSVTISNGITSISDSTFMGCTSLAGVTIPDSVTSIGVNAFANCSKIISLTIPNNVTSIGRDAFSDCDGITSVTIPKSVTTIKRDAFACANLASVTFEGTFVSHEFGDYIFSAWGGVQYSPFLGDLRAKFYATNATNGMPGTYTTTAPVGKNSVWTRQ